MTRRLVFELPADHRPRPRASSKSPSPCSSPNANASGSPPPSSTTPPSSPPSTRTTSRTTRPLDPAPAIEYAARTDARVVVVDADGISLVDTAAPTDRDFSTRPEMAQALLGIQTHRYPILRHAGHRHRLRRRTHRFGRHRPRCPASHHRHQPHHRPHPPVLARTHRDRRLIVAATVALVGWCLARSVTRPVRYLQADADRFADGDLTVRPRPPQGPPELRALATSIATMAARLDAAPRCSTRIRRRRLAPTPLPTHRPAASASRTCKPDSPRTTGPELDAAMEETDRLAALVNDLLQLAKIDNHPALEDHDLARLTTDRLDTWTAVAESRNVTLHATGLDHARHDPSHPRSHRTDPRQPPRQRPQRRPAELHHHDHRHHPNRRQRAPHHRRGPRPGRRAQDPRHPPLLARRPTPATAPASASPSSTPSPPPATATSSSSNGPTGGLSVAVTLPPTAKAATRF